MIDFIKILCVSAFTVLWLSVATAKIASNNAKANDVVIQQYVAPAPPAGADFLRPKETIVTFLQRHGASKHCHKACETPKVEAAISIQTFNPLFVISLIKCLVMSYCCRIKFSFNYKDGKSIKR